MFEGEYVCVCVCINKAGETDGETRWRDKHLQEFWNM